MEKKKGKRINYKIVHCSSEDPEYPVTELLQQSPEAKGWQSKRFGSYPQNIVLQLFQTSIINKIAVLSHQSKIATKIEFEIKITENDDWKKLGRISLDSNSNTNYQARQLKQANINDIQARFIRIILRNNHTNNQNLFNQVGLISVSFYGLRSEELPQVQQRFSGPKNTVEIDNITINKIKQLEGKKKRAVEQQNYDLAKDIKDEIDRLRNASNQISALEQRKQQAIRRENYDDAKLINQQIKRLRQGGNAQEYQQQPSREREREVKPMMHRQQQRRQEEEEPPSISPMSNQRNKTQTQPQPLQQKPRQQKKQINNQPMNNNRGKIEDQDRPIVVKNQNPYAEPQQQQNQGPRQKTGLQALNKQIYQQCSQFFSVFDEDIFRHIFSKDHTNRQRGIEMIGNELNTTRNRQQFIGACLYAIKVLIDDKIASVLISTVSLMGDMMKKLKPQASSYNQPLVEYILQKMGDLLGHINQKIKIVAEDTYSNFPFYHLTNKQICYRALSTIGKRDKSPKILVGRLKMITKIVKNNQLGKDYQQIIKYAVKYADDKNNEVRTAAIGLLAMIAAQIGYNTLTPFIKTLRPPIIQSIQAKIDEQGGMDQPQNFDQKPIKPKTSEKGAQRNKQNQQQDLDSGGNQFIDIPKKGANKNKINEEEICDFCNRVDKRFVQEDYKDMHYYNACPMLIICAQCGQATEISSYTSHLVGECANSKYYKKCPRCKEAVHQKNYKAHTQKKQCLPARPLAANNRCPLCHLDINPGVNGWKEHLLQQKCENNPRA